MSKATISLTALSNGERLVIVWKNINYVTKTDNFDTVVGMNTACLAVKETIEQVEQAIEQAANND